jgi:chromosome segregation ATPase
VLSLQQTVERLERETDRRRAEAEALQARLDMLSKDGEDWRSDLERRERRVKDLEQRMGEWERRRAEAGEERERLGNVVTEVEREKRSLETPPASPRTRNSKLGGASEEHEPETPIARAKPLASGLGLEVQIASLQETHAATLADLSSVTAKYRDALREISDLAAQIQEAKLSAHSEPSEPPLMQAPAMRRRMTSDGPSRRLFFRHAASTESLHSRYGRPEVPLADPTDSVR